MHTRYGSEIEGPCYGSTVQAGDWAEVRKVTERLSLGTEYKFSYPDKDGMSKLAVSEHTNM